MQKELLQEILSGSDITVKEVECFQYRLRKETPENIIRYITKIDGNKYAAGNKIQCYYIDYLVHLLSKLLDTPVLDLYSKYMPITYRKVKEVR